MAEKDRSKSSGQGGTRRVTRSSENSDAKNVIVKDATKSIVKELVQQYSNPNNGPYYSKRDSNPTGKTTTDVQPRSAPSKVPSTSNAAKQRQMTTNHDKGDKGGITTNANNYVENTGESTHARGDPYDTWVIVEHDPKTGTISASSLTDPKLGSSNSSKDDVFVSNRRPEANPAPSTKQENPASDDVGDGDNHVNTAKEEVNKLPTTTGEDRARLPPKQTGLPSSSSTYPSQNASDISSRPGARLASTEEPSLNKQTQRLNVEDKRSKGYSDVEQAITYTPSYTNISEALSKLLEAPGEKSKAIFFYHYISSWNPTTPPSTPVSIDNAKKWKNNDPSFVGAPFSSPERWERIVRALTDLKEICKTERPSQVGRRVADAVNSYCGEAGHSDFEILSGREISQHVAKALPIIVDQALMLPSLLARQIPVLECGQSATLFVTKKLCCSLLANAFFSTFPPQRSNMPDINFHRLFSTSSSDARSNIKVEKIMCILNYFHQMTTPVNQDQFGNNIISYERRHRTQIPDWGESRKGLAEVVVEPRKKIEEMDGMLQVDFANKVVGGGVLNDGAIMEEILFAISPELIISRLFTETLEDNEVLVITGAHQFSEYEGYSSNFAFKKLFHFTNVGTDNLGRLCNQMVAMDALHFKGDPKVQFRQELIDRELQKSYVGFVHGAFNPPVATGNWGCGAFHGDTELKFLIQWMAATEAGRPAMHYHTVGARQQGDSIQHVVDFLGRNKVDVGRLYKVIISFYPDRFDYDSIFHFIEKKLSKKSKNYR